MNSSSAFLPVLHLGARGRLVEAFRHSSSRFSLPAEVGRKTPGAVVISSLLITAASQAVPLLPLPCRLSDGRAHEFLEGSRGLLFCTVS